MSTAVQNVYFVVALFVIVYGLVLAGMNLEEFENKTHMERAVGFYCVFSVALIAGLIVYTLSSCISPARANATLAQMGVKPVF
jgi:uncharacterized membrane protein YfhO